MVKFLRPAEPEAVEINSTSHRKQYMKLNRMVSGARAECFPNLCKLFNGTLQEKKRALALFVQSGENFEQCESTFTVVRETSELRDWVEEHLTVPEMIKEGLSEHLVC